MRPSLATPGNLLPPQRHPGLARWESSVPGCLLAGLPPQGQLFHLRSPMEGVTSFSPLDINDALPDPDLLPPLPPPPPVDLPLLTKSPLRDGGITHFRLRAVAPAPSPIPATGTADAWYLMELHGSKEGGLGGGGFQDFKLGGC